MQICTSAEQYYNILRLFPEEYTIGFVPTMGALHQGHISLVKEAKQKCNKVVVSIFVNPTQFNNKQDLASYPRTLEEDCKLLSEFDDITIFAPNVDEVYPEITISEYDMDGLDLTGEGPRRPGHFNGVVQVVSRLFDIIKPHMAFFGEKDFQQLAIITHMSKKMGYPVQITPCPTVRESDGLAMSSRNKLLTSEQREIAPKIYKALSLAKYLYDTEAPEAITPKLLADWVVEQINKEKLLEVEYIEIVNASSLEILNNWSDAEHIQLCAAVFAHPVRLIDNIKLK